MLKCSSERCVCAPHSLSAGTSTTPMLSVSLRTSLMQPLSQEKQIRADPFAYDPKGDADNGIEEPQQRLLPSVVGAPCRKHHDHRGCYSRCHNIVAPAQ